LRPLPVEHVQILREPVEFADVPIDRRLFVDRQRLPRQPVPTAPVEQVGMRTTRNQVRVQDRMYLVLDPGAVPDNLVPPRNQTAETLRLRVRGPDLRQEAGRVQARQNAGVDLVRLHVGMRDRLHL